MNSFSGDQFRYLTHSTILCIYEHEHSGCKSRAECWRGHLSRQTCVVFVRRYSVSISIRFFAICSQIIQCVTKKGPTADGRIKPDVNKQVFIEEFEVLCIDDCITKNKVSTVGVDIYVADDHNPQPTILT